MQWKVIGKAPEHIRIQYSTEDALFTRSLGELTIAWVQVERVLRLTIQRYAGVTEPVARALFSGTRARTAMEMVEAIAQNTAMDSRRKEDLHEVFTIIRSINTMRDLLTHYADGRMDVTDITDKTRELHSRHKSGKQSEGKIFSVSADLIKSMCHDLQECCRRLIDHFETEGELPPRTRAPAPWRYKPPQPKQRSRGRSM